MEIGEIIEMARTDRGWTKYEAAKRVGIGDQQWVNIESGKTPPSELKVRTLLGLVEAFWPSLPLSELIPDCIFKLEPASPAAMGLLIATSTSSNLHDSMRGLAAARPDS